MHIRTLLALSALALAACAEGGHHPVPSAPSAPAFASTAPFGPEAFSARVVGHGPPMILIPGLACSGDVWAGMVARYGDRYEMHVLTLAGFAGTPPLHQDGSWLGGTTGALARYIHEHHLVKPVVVGHSLGGVVAIDLAETSPDLVGAVVAVDGVPFLPALRDGAATAESVRPIAAKLRDAVVSATPDEARQKNRRALAAMITDPAQVERVAVWEDASDRETMGRAMFDVMTTDLRPGAGKIRAPLLLVAAGNLGPMGPTADDVERAYAEQVDAVPDHLVVVAPRARHFVMLDDPALLYAKVDNFLARTGRAR